MSENFMKQKYLFVKENEKFVTCETVTTDFDDTLKFSKF